MRPVSPDQARELVAHFGSQRPAAAAIGVTRSTLQHWLDPEPARARMARRYYADPETARAQMRDRYWTENGFQRARRLLRTRRANALQRRAERRARRAP